MTTKPCNTLLCMYNLYRKTCHAFAERITRGHKPTYELDPDAPANKPHKGKKKKSNKKAETVATDASPTAATSNADQDAPQPSPTEAKNPSTDQPRVRSLYQTIRLNDLMPFFIYDFDPCHCRHCGIISMHNLSA